MHIWLPVRLIKRIQVISKKLESSHKAQELIRIVYRNVQENKIEGGNKE